MNVLDTCAEEYPSALDILESVKSLSKLSSISDCDATQRAVAKVILGKIKAQGKNPVSLKPYFEIEE